MCVSVCVYVFMHVFDVLHQLRQVSQAKRWDDVGTGRRTIRQSRIIESLEFPDEDFGVNLGIVSVSRHADSVCVCLVTFYSKGVHMFMIIECEYCGTDANT